MTCPSCGAIAPGGARFCPTCGHGLETRADERRIVTVLFADLVGFTGLSEARDPEHVKNLVDRCFERLAADITAHGGRVDKIVGDALVALFGAPVAHEDDAERAVRAALQLQRTISSESDAIGLEIRMRVGVNTGEVLVGALRAGGDYTAMGDVVNVASRLQTIGSPGQVIVGPATHAATRDAVRYDPLGKVQARGREEPIECWTAIEAIAPPGTRPRRIATPLVGREHELGLLTDAVATTVLRRRPHLVVLLGEAGVGKSRLAEEAAEQAQREHDALVLTGRCVPYGEANVWWPVAEAIRQACQIESSDPAGEIRGKCRAVVAGALPRPVEQEDVDRLTEGLLYLMGDEEALLEVEPARALEDALQSIEVLLESQAQARPVLLVLSELHWADDQVLAAIDRLLDRLRSLPVLVLATGRPDLLDRWAPSAGRHNTVVLHVDPLDAVASEQLLSALLGSPAPESLRSALLDRSGGNPFFLEELVALLAEAGVLTSEGGAYRVDGQRRAIDLPATLRGLVAARLDALERVERALLEDAAVVGRSGSVGALAAIAAARGAEPVTDVLPELAARELLLVEGDEWSFRSDLVREVAYDTLAKAERARRHAAVAGWLTQRQRELGREEELEQLAHHAGVAAELCLELGSVPDVPKDLRWTALHAIERAAVRAKQRDSHHTSLRLLDQALRLLPSEDRENTRRVLLARAHSRAATRDTAGARADVELVLPEAEAVGDRAGVASALTILGQAEQSEGAFEASEATLGRAIEEWRSVGSTVGLANALRQLGMTRLFRGDAAAAAQPISDALAAFKEAGDRRGEGWALQNLAWIAFSTGDIECADARIRESLELFDAIGDKAGRSWTLGLLGWVRLTQGLLTEASEIADYLLDDVPDSVGDPWARAMTLTLRANARLWLGDPGGAVAPAREAKLACERVGEPLGRMQAQGTLARALVGSGEIAAGLQELDEMLGADLESSYLTPLLGALPTAVALQLGDPDAAEAANERFVSAGESNMIADGLGHGLHQAVIQLQRGDAAGAVDVLGRVVSSADSAGTSSHALAMLALATAAAGVPAHALAAADSLDDLDAGTYLDRVQAAQAKGFALAQLGRYEAADECFTSVLTQVDSTGDRVAQAFTRLAQARYLEATGRDGADAATRDAKARLEELQIEGAGWDRVFTMAAIHVGAGV